MEIAIIAALFVVALLMLLPVVFKSNAKSVEKQLRKDHLEPIEVKYDISKSTQIKAHVDFTARSKSGDVITGYAYSQAGKWIMHYPPGFDRLAHLRQPESDVE